MFLLVIDIEVTIDHLPSYIYKKNHLDLRWTNSSQNRSICVMMWLLMYISKLCLDKSMPSTST